MTIFFTSDTHFSHARIIELCDRPFKSVEHMNAELIERWNAVVGPDDTVYHLGDVALGNFEQSMNCLQFLNGHKRLVVGNHDRIFHDPDHEANDEKHTRYRARFRPKYQQFFNHIEEGSYKAAAETLLIPYMGINIATGEKYSNQVLRLSHFPYTGDSHDKPRFDAIRPKDDGKVLLHGHTHAKEIVSHSANGTMQIHVGVDSWGYAPVSLETLFVRYGQIK